ncbi:CehA/McbA family metallohydrolase [Streptomyces sp. NPDC127178]|uniref:CehA/McbA family metallohydrolase n=1 Tax=unclassified Streptomyces TaxID=2593676 RepID=UPI00363CFA29
MCTHPDGCRGPGKEYRLPPLSSRRSLLRSAALLAAGGLAAMVPAPLASARAVSSQVNGVKKKTLVFTGRSPVGFDQWASVAFDVPEGVNRISVSTSFDPFVLVPGLMVDVLDIGAVGPSGFRGWSGGARRDFHLSGAEATPGYVPGPIEPGPWAVALGPIVYNPKGMGWEVRVTLEYGEQLTRAPWQRLPQRISGTGQGWYRGDLHLHTVHSDGQRSLDQLVHDARAGGLHFIATTEHNTSSAGLAWADGIPRDLLVINSEEVTTRHGHWLAIGVPQGECIEWRYGPAQPDAFASRAARLRGQGGLAVAAHPCVPGPGSLWEFGTDAVDALEVWNGPWTLDDALAVALWDVQLRLGRRIAAVGGSDAHSPAETVGHPQTVVQAPELSREALVNSLRRGRCYLAESAGVTVELIAKSPRGHAGPGQTLTFSLFEAVEVEARIVGAPGAVLSLHTEWGMMVAVTVPASGQGRVSWRGWARGSMFVRAEARRLKPGSSTIDQMVALTNPVFFRGAARRAEPQGQRLIHTVRQADGSWTPVADVAARRGTGAFRGTQACLAGLPDGGAHVLAIGQDDILRLGTLDADGAAAHWQKLPVPFAGAGMTRDAALACAPDATAHILVTDINHSLHHAVRTPQGALSGFSPVPGRNERAWRAVKASAAVCPDGSLHVAGFHTDGALYHCIRRPDGRWARWTRLSGPRGARRFTGCAVAITALPDGSCQIIATDLDGHLWHQVTTRAGRWSGFTSPEGGSTPQAAATSVDIAGMPNGDAHIVAVGLDGRVRHRIRTAQGHWSPSTKLPGLQPAAHLTAGQVRITATPTAGVHLIAITPG